MARRQGGVDGYQIDLAEYERLRQEIDNRTQIAAGFVALELTALAAGLASFDALPDVVIGISVASSCLWMLWSDQEVQIWKVAAYLEIELAPRLREVRGDALGWEAFLRRVDRGGPTARQALRVSGSAPTGSPFPTTRRVGFYASLLFGGAPLALLLVGVGGLFADMSGTARAVRALMLCGALVMWIAALYVYRQSRALSSLIDAAIDDHAPALPSSHVDRADDTSPGPA